MTGNELLNSAAEVMGFESATKEMQKIGLTVINSVLEDLGKKSIQGLNNSLEGIKETEKQACIYGTALFLSVAFGDLRSKECFLPIYNEKRNKVKHTKTFVSDSLPKGELT